MGEVLWKDLPGLKGRSAPVVIDSIEQLQSMPNALDLENVMKEFPIEGLFCVQEVPQIIFMKQDTDDIGEIRRFQKALWNQGLARILAVQSPDLIRVFSIANTVETNDNEAFEKQLQIKGIDTTKGLLSFEQLVFGVESGSFWGDNTAYFDPQKRIDHVLLNNLVKSHNRLCELTLSCDQSHAALIQTMFIAYLEDRRIIGASYVRENTNDEHDTFSSILLNGDVKSLLGLYSGLKRDFNGDLFITPCSFTNQRVEVKLSPEILGVLAQFRSGKVEMQTGQCRLPTLTYDFNYTPIALISEVYDSFLNQTSKAQQSIGAFYTPIFLVDTVVSHIWKDISSECKAHGKFLDPACGSGVFLVRCFQRLCQHLKVKSNKNSWEKILSIIQRIKGCDVDAVAVRVAVFSLYLAMFEVENPANLDKMPSKRPKLPKLLNKTIKCGNYFNFESRHTKADVILGNPPWSGEKKAAEIGRVWCESKKLPCPAGQLAWAFVWKAKHDVNRNGKVAFLLPSGSFLHNIAKSSMEARVALFENSHVRSVINFSDLRQQLFKNSTHPTAFIVFDLPKKVPENYRVEYWVPKSDLNVHIKQYIVLNAADKNYLMQANIVRLSSIFSQKFWLTFPESRLYSHLSVFPRLSSVVKEFRTSTGATNKPPADWLIGGGYQQRIQNRKAEKKLLENFINGERLSHLAIDFTPLAIIKDDLSKGRSIEISSAGFTQAYFNPRILVARGIKTGRKRLTVAYSETPLVFQEYTRAICFPKGESKQAKLLTAILNSKLAMWFLFHISSSIASSRKIFQQSELLKFPFPKLEDFPSVYRTGKDKLQDRLVEIIDVQLKNSLRQNENLAQETFDEIDSLTYKYYGLVDTEIALIEDTVDYILDASQPSQAKISKSAYFNRSDSSMRQKYAEQLSKSMEIDLESEDDRLSVELIAHNKDFGILKISYCNTTTFKPYQESGEGMFDQEIRRIPKLFEKLRDSNIQSIPDFRIYEEDWIFLVKPIQQRFWLRSSAIDDAAEIIGEIISYSFWHWEEQHDR